jgi:hypothetical protein
MATLDYDLTMLINKYQRKPLPARAKESKMNIETRKKIRRKIEDAVRKTATDQEMMEIAKILGVSKEYEAQCQKCWATWVETICCIDSAADEAIGHKCVSCASDEWIIK